MPVVKQPTEYDTFTQAVERILSVPKAEVLRREAEYKRQADLNPNKRGPKVKRKQKAVKSSASAPVS